MGKFSKVASILFLFGWIATFHLAHATSLSGQFAITYQQAPNNSSEKHQLEGREYSLLLENPDRGLRLSYWTTNVDDSQGNIFLSKKYESLSVSWKEKALTSGWGQGYFIAGAGGSTTYSTTRISSLTDIESNGPSLMGIAGIGVESDALKFLRFGVEVRIFFLENLPPSPFLQAAFFLGILFP